MNKRDLKSVDKASQATLLLATIHQTQSFSKTAEILGIQQSAVSHRIRQLETHLQTTLFERTTRTFATTRAGEILCSAAVQSLAAWEAAFETLENERDNSTIRLSVSSSLAMRWLIPILPKAQGLGFRISLTIDDGLTDFSRRQADVGLRFGIGPYPGLHSQRLCGCKLQPVCASSYLDKDRGSFDSQNICLLSDRAGETDTTEHSWTKYFRELGQSNAPAQSAEHTFDRTDLMLQAAVNGMGIGLGRSLLIEQDLASGYLVTYGRPVGIKSAYWLVCSPSFTETPRFHKLATWLKSEAKTTLGLD